MRHEHRLRPKFAPPGSILSPEANQAAALATATGVLTVDLDAIVANWRKLEKTAVPAECAGVVKANAYGCGAEPVARALAGAGCKTFFVATLDEARARPRGGARRGRDLCARRLLPEQRRRLRQDRRQARDRRSQRTRRMGRVLPPLRLGRRRRHPHRYRHEPARPDGRGSAGHHSPDQRRRSRHHAGDEPPRLRRDPQSSAQRQAARRLSARSPACFPACRRRCRIRPVCFLGAAVPVRPGAAGRRPLRHQPDAGSRQSDAAGGRGEGAHRADPQYREGRHRRLRRHLDRAAADPARDRLRRLCRRLFPRRQQQ